MAGSKEQRELDEARKNGMLPPEKDAEGNLINPHIPEFMSKAPWYMNQEGPTLEHQRLREKPNSEWAKKRDPYANWDSREYRLMYKRFQQMEKERQAVRAEQREKERQKKEARKKRRDERRAKKKAEKEEKGEGEGEEAAAGAGEGGGGEREASASDTASDTDTDTDLGSSSDSEAEDVRQKDSHEAVEEGVERFGTKNKMTVRNLRIREDKAKYLYNLNVDSAYYDPKTRSMRDNPLPHLDPAEVPFAGDNVVLGTGEAPEVAQSQVFAWEMYEAGQDVHLQGNPTLITKMQSEVRERKKKAEEARRKKLLEQYGGEEHLRAPPRELLVGQTEQYVEYTRDGRVARKPDKKGVIRSKYEEDVLEGNHKAVWGSWYDKHARRWGYACCRSTTRGAHCTGAAGIAAQRLAERRREAQRLMAEQRAQEKSLVEQNLEKVARGEAPARRTGSGLVSGADLYGESGAGNGELDARKVEAAMARQAEEESRDDGTGGFTAGAGEEEKMTAEELEAYHLRRTRAEDPMANYVDEGETEGRRGKRGREGEGEREGEEGEERGRKRRRKEKGRKRDRQRRDSS